MFPLARYLAGKPVIIEALAHGTPEEAFAVAQEYLARLARLKLDTGFVRALWFRPVGPRVDGLDERTCWAPGVLLVAGRYVPPRAMQAFRWRELEIQPWYFAKEF